MLAPVHVDTLAAEGDAFKLEPRSLLCGGGLRQLDLSAGAYDTMPGQLIGRVRAEQPGHSPMIKRVTSGGGDCSVGAYLAGRNREYDATEGAVTIFMGPTGVAQ